MSEPQWHLQEAKKSLEDWYASAEEYLELAEKFSKLWLFGKSARECKQQALKCKTFGLVFHDRFKLLVENKS